MKHELCHYCGRATLKDVACGAFKLVISVAHEGIGQPCRKCSAPTGSVAVSTS